MKHYLLLFSVVGVIHAAVGEVGYVKSGNSRVWPFLRGSIEFTVRHPLRLFHGKFEKMWGSANVEPEDLGKGLQFQIEGNTRDVSFQESEGKKISQWIGGGTPWKIESHSFLPHGVGEEGLQQVELILNFSYAGRVTLEKLLATCQTDAQVLKCRFETKVLAYRVGIPLPKLMGIASNEDFTARGEFVFGEKEGPK